jgi:predicted enzyme related to lactoylglutathione lyase
MRAGCVANDDGKARFMDDLLLRTTFIIEDMEAAVDFYTSVFDWKVVYDVMLNVDRRFPPAAPEGAPCRLVIFQAEDPLIGGIGFMKYTEHALPKGPDKNRPLIGQGEAILVIQSADPDAVYEKVKKTSARIIAPPSEWSVPSPTPGKIIKLRSLSLCDPNGLYMECNYRYPGEYDA